MSDETKEIIESQMNDMRKELADMHTNVGRIMECLDTMREILLIGETELLTQIDVEKLIKLQVLIYNAARRC